MEIDLKAIKERAENDANLSQASRDRAALLKHIARLQGIISYVRECEGGPALLAEAEAGEPLRQDDMREEVADLQAALARQSEAVRMLTEVLDESAAQLSYMRAAFMKAHGGHACDPRGCWMQTTYDEALRFGEKLQKTRAALKAAAEGATK